MAVPIISTAASTDVQISSSTPSVLMGVCIVETAAGVATVSLKNGTSSSDPIGWQGNLAASTSATFWFGPQGIKFHNGIFLDRLTGTTLVICYIA